MRKFLAVLLAAALGMSACSSPMGDGSPLPGMGDEFGNTAPAATPATATPLAEKPLVEILIEAGYNPRGFDVHIDARGDSATIRIPDVLCPITVSSWMEGTYAVDRVGDQPVTNLPVSLGKALGGTSPSADTVENALKKAQAAGQLKGVC